MKRILTLNLRKTIFIGLLSSMICNPALAQVSSQEVDSRSIIEGEFNNVFQIPNQNNNQNQNLNEINFPRQPLDNPIFTPPNSENNFGLNMSVGINTLDDNNITVYLGAIYHPGKSKSHNLRMKKIAQEIELLETQKNIAQSQLQLLQQKVKQVEIELNNR